MSKTPDVIHKNDLLIRGGARFSMSKLMATAEVGDVAELHLVG